MKVVVIGSSNIDMVAQVNHLPAPGETVGDASFMQSLGGKGANQAVAAARLGGSVTFVTSLGNDMYADILRKNFENRRAARVVELVYVVHLLHLHVILSEAVHHLGEIAVYGGEDGDTYREVGRPKQRMPLFATHPAHIVTVVFHPSGRAAHHFHAFIKRFEKVAIRSLRSGELYRHVGRGKFGTVEVMNIVHFDYTYDFMTAAKGNLLYHLAHLAVSYQCYFHVQLLLYLGKDTDF